MATFTDHDWMLRFKVFRGFYQRGYPLTPEYVERIEFELGVIAEMSFAPYFLIVADLCRFMSEQGIRYLVRGSGCGSMCVWGLGISHRWLDPIVCKLPFERFLNPSRVSMPDLDMDIQDDRRSEVVAYTIDKYGSDRVARIITFGSLGVKAAIRDVVRALQIPNGLQLADTLCGAIPATADSLDDALRNNDYLVDQVVRQPDVFEFVRRVEGKIRNPGIHAAGVVITPEPMVKFMPAFYKGSSVDRSPEDSVPATQWDMYDCENRGLLKMDFLGLKTLRVIDQCVRAINAIRAARNEPAFDLDMVDRLDPATWRTLGLGDLAGVFQIERQFVRDFAKRMNLAARPDPIQLAVLVSIIRPGMMDTGATEMYLRRAGGLEEVTPIIPKLGQLGTLSETYQLQVFQEDVMAVARALAGFTLAEADNLRRAIGKKKPEEIARIKPEFIRRAVAHSNITEHEAQVVWEQSESFARYGLCKGHAAAYGMVLSYQTAYLKTHFPTVFMAHLIDSESGVSDTDAGYNYKVAEYVEEARRLGIKVLPPSVMKSGVACGFSGPGESLELRFGLGLIKYVGASAAAWIARPDGPCRQALDFDEFLVACFEVVDDQGVHKVLSRVGSKEIEALIAAGALDCYGLTRAEMLAAVRDKSGKLKLWKAWHADEASRRNGKKTRATPEQRAEAARNYTVEPVPMTLEQQLEMERAYTGCYLANDPFAPFASWMGQFRSSGNPHLYSTGALTEGDMPLDHYYAVYGQVVDLRTSTIKKGQHQGAKMWRVKLRSIGADLDVAIFPEEIDRLQKWWGVMRQQYPQLPEEEHPLQMRKVCVVSVYRSKTGKYSVSLPRPNGSPTWFHQCGSPVLRLSDLYGQD